jgi:SnoaL-like protein
VDTEAAARAWIEAWAHSWPTGDPEPVGALFADDGLFASHPFREPYIGPDRARQYVRWASEDEQSVECSFGEPIVSGDRAAIEWWAVVKSRDGAEGTIAGASIVRFDSEGRVVEDCAYWTSEAGRHEPPPMFRPAVTSHT